MYWDSTASKFDYFFALRGTGVEYETSSGWTTTNSAPSMVTQIVSTRDSDCNGLLSINVDTSGFIALDTASNFSSGSTSIDLKKKSEETAIFGTDYFGKILRHEVSSTSKAKMAFAPWY